jgi:AcrR family transcriptional regulator
MQDWITGERLRFQKKFMKKSTVPKNARKPRADAQRNRERILEVAKQVFTRRGAEASMDEIAKRAKIGPGTLYRHFPTRDELLATVYIAEVEKLAAAQRKLSAELPPIEALRTWLLVFIDYIASKKIIAPALNAMAGGPSRVFQQTTQVMEEAANALASRAVASGDLRSDIDPMDLLRASMASPPPAVQTTGPQRRVHSSTYSFGAPAPDRRSSCSRDRRL